MLYLTFIWHFHQPSYWDPIRRIESMPWVRLHSIKSYTDMADALEKHPDIKANVNLVPSLLDRWADLSENEFHDEYFRIASIPASELELEQKEMLLLRFFQANWDTMINPYPRYHRLLVKRGHRLTPDRLKKVIKEYSEADFRDLQVWFNLCWFGYSAIKRYKELHELIQKDDHFNEEDKDVIWKIQKQLISELIPRYRALWEQGQIEITTSPYYHPILPLLVDSQCARRGLMMEPMPTELFQAPEDARVQLERAATRVKELLGKKPIGLWPSEGSVSMESMQLASECGFRWAASDEGILWRSLEQPQSAERLYQSYKLEVDPPMSLVFRDRGLSDAIGFRYSKLPAKQAAAEFLENLKTIESSQKKGGRAPLVSVILDGENPWEYFSDSGENFLDHLYKGLKSDRKIKTVNLREYLADYPPQQRLKSLFPGSWINSNFRVWIGDSEKNRAWDLLYSARQVLKEEQDNPTLTSEKRSSAWEALYRAEGSDWFWWYGDIYNSDNDAEFDRLFRNNLREIYQQLKKDIPPGIDRPNLRRPGLDRRVQPAFTMTPVLDGKVTSYYEWVGACKYDVGRAGGAMSLPDARVQQIFYGYDVESLYLRVDFKEEISLDFQSVQFHFNGTPSTRFIIERTQESQGFLEEKKPDGSWFRKGPSGKVAWDEILEVKIPFDSLGVSHSQELEFSVLIIQQETIVEQWPLDGVIQFLIPSVEDMTANWCV